MLAKITNIAKLAKNVGLVEKKLLAQGFQFLYHLHNCGFKLEEQLRYLRVTFVKLASRFKTPVHSVQLDT